MSHDFLGDLPSFTCKSQKNRRLSPMYRQVLYCSRFNRKETTGVEEIMSLYSPHLISDPDEAECVSGFAFSCFPSVVSSWGCLCLCQSILIKTKNVEKPNREREGERERERERESEIKFGVAGGYYLEAYIQDFRGHVMGRHAATA